jgi:steroid delta-isomerase
MSTSTEQTVTEYFAAIRAMDVERWVNTFTPDATTRDPAGTPAITGHEALRGFLTHILGSFRSIGLYENHVYVSGNSAAIQWTGRAESKSGKQVEFAGIDVIDCNDEGKIVLVRAFWDPAPVFAAIAD